MLVVAAAAVLLPAVFALALSGWVVRRDADLSARIDSGRLRWTAFMVAVLLSPFVFVLAGDGSPARLVMVAAVAAVWTVASLVDLRTKRLPDVLTFGVAAVLVVLHLPEALTAASVAEGLRPYLAAVAVAVVFYVLAFAVPSGFGLGDVKLGLSTGFVLGMFGWQQVVWGSLLAFVLMSLVGVVAGLVTRRGIRGAEYPFGPFMVAAAFVVAGGSVLLGG